MSDQGNQCVLLSAGKLAETLQQLSLMQGQLRAIQTQAQLIVQYAFLEKCLLQASDDFRVHAAMMVARDFRNTFAHAVR